MHNSYRLAFICLSFLPCFSFAAFPIRSIECKDSNPTANLNVFFTTIDKAARVSGDLSPNRTTIGYDYGNKKSPFGDRQAGRMSLQNVLTLPGVITLVDLYEPPKPTQLVLAPTQNPNIYSALLTGNIETAQGWGHVTNYKLDCLVSQ